MTPPTDAKTWPVPLKGVVLAAGFGTRLRPLTDARPKPLIPFLGSTPLDRAADLLRTAGIRDFAVNAHYQSEQIKTWATEQRDSWLVSIEDEILGTGGAFAPLKSWQGDHHIMAINGDVVADFDLTALIEQHVKSKALATMMVLPQNIPGENAVFYEQNKILDIGKIGPEHADRGNYGCAQILSPAFVASMPDSGFYDIIFAAGYKPSLAAGETISCAVHAGEYWHDIRDPQAYAEGVFDVLRRGGGPKEAGRLIEAGEREMIQQTLITGPAWIGPSVSFKGESELGPNIVLEQGCEIRSSKITHGILWPGTAVADQNSSHVIYNGDQKTAYTPA